MALSLTFSLFIACLSLVPFAVLLQERRKASLLLARSEAEIGEQRRQLAQLSRIALLSELSGAIAHEINQPLTAILINAETAVRLMKHEAMDVDALRGALDDIMASDRHAISVVQRLRGLLHSGESQYQPIDLNETAASALVLARSDLARRRVKVETKFAAHLGSAHGDPVQIQQVILNLIVNACEAMMETPTAQRRLRLVTRYEPRLREVELAVTDCGAGLTPPRLETIFQPFVTVKRHGMGLGLAICRSIIEAHGGRIWAESAPVGAIFRFTLPRKA